MEQPFSRIFGALLEMFSAFVSCPISPFKLILLKVKSDDADYHKEKLS